MSRTITHTIVRPSFADSEQEKYEVARRRFHQLGRQVYGSRWDEVRPSIVMVVTKGAISTSKQLCRSELVQAATILALLGEQE